MFGLRGAQKRFRLHPELTRKLFHIGGGLGGLALPWVFSGVWPVVILSVIIAASLFLLQRTHALKARAGGVLGGVGRVSLGEVYFPLSVCIIYLLARRDLVLYSVPILILTFADAVAALIGVRYGQSRYETTDGAKSIEGSVAFFVAAFFSVHVPILLCSRTGRPESLLIALNLGLLIMILEAISWAGLDNLFVPIVSFLILKVFFGLSVGDLLWRLVVTGLLALLLTIGGRHSSLNAGARLGAIMIGYVIWAAGDWRWVLMPVILFACYRRLSPPTRWDDVRVHNFQVVLMICSAGLVWLFLAQTLEKPQLLFPFTIGFAVHLAIIGIVRHSLADADSRLPAIILAQSLKSWLALMLPYAIIAYLQSGLTKRLGEEVSLALGVVLLASVGYCWIAPKPDLGGVDLRRWGYQAGTAGLVSCLGVLPWLFH